MLTSTLPISGGSASIGRFSTTRETASRTSLTADSMSRSAVNSIVIRERSSMLEEVSLSTPSMPAMRFSITCVIFDSTMSADAPR
jgi:hypothetical protein